MKRNRHFVKLTLLGFISHERLLLICHEGPYVIFCYCDDFADAPVNGKLLTLTTQTLTICKGKKCSVDAFLYSAAGSMSHFITQLI